MVITLVAVYIVWYFQDHDFLEIHGGFEHTILCTIGWLRLPRKQH